MNVWFLDFEKFIKVNRLQEVTNPIMLESGNIPTLDGLFSTEIFGISTSDRKENFAYIDLHLKFLNPKVFLTLKRLNRNFEAVVYGTKKFVIKDGILEVDNEHGSTGLKWLYANWEKFNFPKNDSEQRGERIDLLTIHKKDVIFTSKFLVIPAFYRDINLKSAEKNPRVPEINDLYSKIIRNVATIVDATNMESVLEAMTGKVQQLLVDIYNLLKEKIQGKNGYIRKYLMGKTVDYSSRVVITACPYTANHWKQQECNFYQSGIPLSHCCSQFTPFILHWVNAWFKRNLENNENSYPFKKTNGEPVLLKLNKPMVMYNSAYIEEMLEKFVDNPAVRYERLELPIDKEQFKYYYNNVPQYMGFAGKRIADDIHTIKQEDFSGIEGELVNRYLTWTDLFYMAAVDVTKNKHVWITRYPFTDYLGMYVSRISVLSTRKTAPMIVNGKLYEHYPVIDPRTKKSDMDAEFRDTINPAACYLSAIEGDFDGDQITSAGVFTQEANEECERILMAKTNLITVQGTPVRGTGNEGIQTLYSLTEFR